MSLLQPENVPTKLVENGASHPNHDFLWPTNGIFVNVVFKTKKVQISVIVTTGLVSQVFEQAIKVQADSPNCKHCSDQCQVN
jgi:hypothetical protein